ncbi:hypothetical protein KKA14_20150, partial [bacterium]|nr:hypothetical protein [bacterium]
MRDQLSHPLYTKRRRKTYFQLFSDLTTGLISIILCLVIIPGLAKGQIKSNQTSLTASSLSMLLKSIEDSIETENKNIKKLEEEDSQSKKLSKILNDEITASNFRFTTFSSFLFLPDVSVVNLENAFSTLHISYVGLEEQLNNLIKKKQVFIEYKAATDKQYSDVLKQLSEFRINKSNRKISRSIQNNLKTIKSVIGQKQNLIDKLLLFYTNEIDQLTKAQEDFSELSARYEKKLAEQKDQDLFHQDTNLFFKDWNKQLSSSWNTFLHQGKSFLTLEFWIMKAGLVQKSNQFESISFVFLFAVVLIIGWRFKRFIVAFQTKHSFQKYPSTFLPLLLLEKSAFFSWITIYFYFYLQIQSLSLISSLIRIVMDPLITWLFTGWGLVLINNWNNR